MSSTGTVRYADAKDLPAIRALMMRNPKQRHIDERLLSRIGRGRHLLVLDDENGAVVAAAMFSIVNRHGRLHLLVVAPEADEAHALEQRMLGVIEAMCDAYGAKTLEVAADHAA
jgi:N-acetylglutamate synthase-like GNAT family acetyltransferase